MTEKIIDNKLIRINELMSITGFSRPTPMKLLYNTVLNGSSNSIYNKKLKLYAVRNIDTFYGELSDVNINNQEDRLCQQKNKQKDYTKDGRFIGSIIPIEELAIGYQLKQSLLMKQ